MDDSRSAANAVAQAIAATLDWSSPPDSRNAAFAYLESFKSRDARILASTSLLLVRKDWPSQIRLHGFKMLQHLVRLRWDDLIITEKSEFTNMVVNLARDVVNPHEEWALRSQTAALIAEVVRREGVSLWHELLPNLVSLSNEGPVEAELVSMVLRWLPEDITVHNEDLEGERLRVLLRGLTESLNTILPLLYTLLEKHFGAALHAHARQQMDMTRQHATTVIAALNAVNAYAEWAPVPDLAKYGIINGCGSLLSYSEFRLHACEFFKFVCQRKKPADDTAADFASAVTSVFQILMNVSRDFFNKWSSSASNENELEFTECICECVVALASSNLQCISADGTMISQSLYQMLEYYRNPKLALHFQSLLFWLVIMRESKPKTAGQGGSDYLTTGSFALGCGSREKEKLWLDFVGDDIFAAIMDTSLKRMLKKAPPHSSPAPDTFELWSEEFSEKTDFGRYRSRLLELIKLIAVQKPFIAASTVSERINAIIKNPIHAPLPPQDLALTESMQLGLETVVSAIFDGSPEVSMGSPETKLQLKTIFEGLLQQLLSLEWNEPTLAIQLGRYLDAFGPYLKHYPDSVAGIVNKLFALLTSLPSGIKDPSSNNGRLARLQICQSFIRIARAAERSLLPHMKGIADTMAYLQGEGHLSRAEHNLLGEAFLVISTAAGIQQQQEVLAWLLEPLSKQWTQLEWQSTYLSEPFGLTHLCSKTEFMWSIFHTVTFFEKALKRSGTRKSNLNVQGSDVCSNPHPMSPHLSWMLPALLRLLRSVHSLWSQQVALTLTSQFKAAKSMSDVEQASVLGENHKLHKGLTTSTDVSRPDFSKEAESNENDIRNWIKGIRDSGYNVLGLSATIGDAMFRLIEGASVALALVENIQMMEFRHIRLLIHLVIIPLIKFCPSDLWATWLQNILHPLFVHCQQALACSWASLIHEGRAIVPDTFGNLSGLDLKVEVMEERLLRDLTREVCSLLGAMGSPSLNSGLPSLEQLGPNYRIEPSSLKGLDNFVSNSMVSFLMVHKGSALPALKICLDVITWTDGEAVAKVIPFCGSLILLAVSTNSVELREFVAKDLFFALIQGLALESNAFISSDLVGFCREIYVYLSEMDPGPRQVLLSLPSISRNELLAFDDALSKTTSPKEQRQHMKSVLLLATGNKLKALAAQKNMNVITNVTARTRISATAPGPTIEEDGHIGLAAIT